MLSATLVHTNVLFFDCETSNVCLCKLLWNPFLEPTNAKQEGQRFLFNETTAAFDVAWQPTSQAISSASRQLRLFRYARFYQSIRVEQKKSTNAEGLLEELGFVCARFRCSILVFIYTTCNSHY